MQSFISCLLINCIYWNLLLSRDEDSGDKIKKIKKDGDKIMFDSNIQNQVIIFIY
jgi:hypothetical protein